MNPTVKVIGSGVGGLATAIRLASMGMHVTVYEKNSFVGGKVHSRTFNGYRFDMGPSVFTEPHLIDELLDLGKSRNTLTYSALPESGRYFFEDGTRLNVASGTEGTIKCLVEELGESYAGSKKYLKRIQKNYRALYPVFIETSLHRWKHLFTSKILRALWYLPNYGLLTTMNGFSKRYFQHEKTVQLLNRFATYNGSDPYQTPGLLSIIGHLELNVGSFFPEGGMVSISRNLEETARSLGVEFVVDSEVQSIETENGRVKGVQVNGVFERADIVVSNADVHHTYERLLPQIERPKKILGQEMSSSAVVFYWGIEREFSELGVHNVFFSKDYKAEFQAIFKDKTLFDDPTVYIHISCKVEPSDAPSGCENWFVMVNAPVDIGQDWSNLVQELRKKVLRKLSQMLHQDIEALIRTEHINDPITLQQTYNGKGGSIYGNSSNSSMAAFYRHPNFATKVKGLYFAGVTVHPGGGIPLALNGAKIVGRLIKEDYQQAVP
jgi:phytoene desaturase